MTLYIINAPKKELFAVGIILGINDILGGYF